ncbi:MAG: hypothetical protein ACLTEE_07945 [Anaerobutyricum hallii]
MKQTKRIIMTLYPVNRSSIFYELSEPSGRNVQAASTSSMKKAYKSTLPKV